MRCDASTTWTRSVGLAIGIPASIAVGYAMTTQLFEVQPYSPTILLVTTVVLSLAALIASLVPAWTGIEPRSQSRLEDGVRVGDPSLCKCNQNCGVMLGEGRYLR
jgi:hypothetical protein